jgi:CTP synthase
LFCNVKESAVISAQDVDTIYDVPLAFHEQALDSLIVSLLGLEQQAPQRI